MQFIVQVPRSEPGLSHTGGGIFFVQKVHSRGALQADCEGLESAVWLMQLKPAARRALDQDSKLPDLRTSLLSLRANR